MLTGKDKRIARKLIWAMIFFTLAFWAAFCMDLFKIIYECFK